MRVLVACEYSGRVRDAFMAKGHDAWSNDLLEASGQHLQMDCMDAMEIGLWDLIIMHPPCTALAVSGNRWYGKGCKFHTRRVEAVRWTMGLWRAALNVCRRVCMENPIGVIPMKPSQIIQPWEFGHKETKATCLYLKNLPPLFATELVSEPEGLIHKMSPSKDRSMKRSLTYQGWADAMADQWG